MKQDHPAQRLALVCLARSSARQRPVGRGDDNPGMKSDSAETRVSASAACGAYRKLVD